VIIVAAKFVEGAWIVIFAIPATMALLFATQRYYARLNRRLKFTAALRIEETQPPTVLVPYEGRNRMTDRALRFAMTLSPDAIAVHLVRLGGPELEEDIAATEAAFDRDICCPLRETGVKPPRLVAVPAPYREIQGPILDFVDKIDVETPGRSVAILTPELVLRHWWERLLHSRRAARLRTALLAHARPRLKVVSSPWRD